MLVPRIHGEPMVCHLSLPPTRFEKTPVGFIVPQFSCQVPHRISRASLAFMQWGWEPACIRHVGSVKKIQILFKGTCVKFAVQGRSPLGAVIFLNFYFFGVKK